MLKKQNLININIDLFLPINPTLGGSYATNKSRLQLFISDYFNIICEFLLHGRQNKLSNYQCKENASFLTMATVDS